MLPAGTYYARVFAAAEPVATAYSLRLQADLNWTTIKQGGANRSVGLVFADGATRPIDKTRQTWVIVHGWTGTPDSLAGISSAVRDLQPGDQVLVLDWSAAADAGLLAALGSVGPAAGAAATMLKRWGIPGSQINLIGHSFGGFLIERMAAGIPGGVNRMVAIDPADNPFVGVNYAARSKFSLAFIASSYSTPAHALTADVTFKLDVGSYSSIFAHMAAPALYASMLQANADGSPDDVSRLFALDNLSPTSAQPWKTGTGYEGTLTGKSSFLIDWQPDKLTYKAASDGRTVTVVA